MKTQTPLHRAPTLPTIEDYDAPLWELCNAQPAMYDDAPDMGSETQEFMLQIDVSGW